MPKVKIKRKQPKLDMNPMVDLAFLLVTFFMLTTTFKSEEPVTVETPSSTSDIKLPEKNIMTITVADEGQIFFSIDGKFARDRLLNLIGNRYDVEFSEDEARSFSLMSSFGMPISGLKELLQMTPNERREVDQPGIPCDSIQNELVDWIVFSRITNPKLRIAIKADQNVRYPVVKQIIATLVDNKITRFNLITDLEVNMEEQQ